MEQCSCLYSSGKIPIIPCFKNKEQIPTKSQMLPSYYSDAKNKLELNFSRNISYYALSLTKKIIVGSTVFATQRPTILHMKWAL